MSSPTITLQTGDGHGREIVINRELMIVGREADSDIIIPETNVSRHHAAIRTTPEGVFVEDLGSVNGTFVNSAPIIQIQIKHQDVIQIGSSMLVFNDPNNPVGPVAARGADSGEAEFSFDTMHDVIARLRENIGIVFKGKPDVIRNMIVCLMADGHLLLEDAPRRREEHSRAGAGQVDSGHLPSDPVHA
ncbi:MAG: FHA domain-containing protein [Lentisphaeria bacterium]|nr:MAG: FHA domain-containing protein [Lentisphaeria bacterium]